MTTLPHAEQLFRRSRKAYWFRTMKELDERAEKQIKPIRHPFRQTIDRSVGHYIDALFMVAETNFKSFASLILDFVQFTSPIDNFMRSIIPHIMKDLMALNGDTIKAYMRALSTYQHLSVYEWNHQFNLLKAYGMENIYVVMSKLASIYTALRAYRQAKRIYQFSQELEEALDEKLPEAFPTRHFHIPLHGAVFEYKNESVFTFYDLTTPSYVRHFSHPDEPVQYEARFLSIPKGEGSIDEVIIQVDLADTVGGCHQNTMENMKNLVQTMGGDPTVIQEYSKVLALRLNSVLYITANASRDVETVRPQSQPKRRPQDKRERERLLDLREPGIYRVGGIYERVLRRWKRVTTASYGSSGRTVRPHIRAAHAHLYWRGPRKDPEKRTPVVHFLPPIPVNFKKFGLSVDDLAQMTDEEFAEVVKVKQGG